MFKSRKKLSLLIVIMVISGIQLKAQTLTASSKDAEEKIDEESLYRDVTILCDSLCSGRGCGTPGGSSAAFYIASRFKSEGIVPFNDNYFHNFRVQDKVGHNVIGVLQGNDYSGSDKYIIVAAHYDNIGTIDGHIYQGADSNASGVAAMLGIARMFSYMRSGNRNYNQHIIFVALDGKQLNMSGAGDLWHQIEQGKLISPINGKPVRRQNVTMFVNLDILGSSNAPIHDSRPDYMILLGSKQEHSRLYRTTNENYNIYLDLGYDYYGSKSFTDMFLKRVSDQKIFLDNGIYSVMFTSGITYRTNKEDDTVDSLNFTVLKRRSWLIFHWLERVIQIL